VWHSAHVFAKVWHTKQLRSFNIASRACAPPLKYASG
jgi:hypothetical protein